MRLIDADRLMAHLMDWALHDNAPEIRECMKAVEEQPIVDPVKYGRWITSNYVINNGTKSQTEAYTECKCSVCGGVFGRMSDLFCYRCGAKMDGGNDEID